LNSGIPNVKVSRRDDNLGLGATLNPADPEHNRVGIDAFQSLLGRLNGKDESETERLEQRIEDRRLASWTQGRWGGVLFISGGLLVQEDKIHNSKEKSTEPRHHHDPPEKRLETLEDKTARRRASKRKSKFRRQQERQLSKLTKKRAGSNPTGAIPDSGEILTTTRSKEFANKPACDGSEAQDPDVISIEEDKQASNSSGSRPNHNKKGRSQTHQKKPTPSLASPNRNNNPKETPDTIQPAPHNPRNNDRRHLLRARNIQAKRTAFSAANARLLDEILLLPRQPI
jgi:hypothetical protein